MKNLKIDIFKGPEGISALANDWSGLASKCRWPVYSCPEWYLAWGDVFGNNAAIYIITARVDGELIGILPICKKRTNKHGLFFSIMEPLSGSMCDYHCPVIADGWESRTLPQMLEKAFNVYNFRNTFIWPHIPIDHPAVPVIREFIKQNSYLCTEQKDVCPQLMFQKDYVSTENIWESKHRRDIRRQRRRIAEIGKMYLWTANSKNEMKSFLQEFFQIHAEKWQSQGFPAKCDNPLIQKYLYCMVERLWDKGLHVSALMCGNERISYHFGFLSGGWLLCYITAYRIKYQNLSPTKVHYSLFVEEGIRKGWKGLDFLIGNESYKYSWASSEKEVISFIVGRKYITPSYFWFSTGKPMVKRRFEIIYFNLLALIEKCFKKRSYD